MQEETYTKSKFNEITITAWKLQMHASTLQELKYDIVVNIIYLIYRLDVGLVI